MKNRFSWDHNLWIFLILDFFGEKNMENYLNKILLKIAALILLTAIFATSAYPTFLIDGGVNENLVIEIPKNKSITVDGKMNEEEWKDAWTQDLKNQGNIKISHDGECLQIGLNGEKNGLSHIYLTDGEDVFVLHASAALGMAVYRKEGEVWQPVQKFKWELRDQSTNTETSSAYFKTNGWLASVNSPPTTEREYKITMKFKKGEEFQLAAVYVVNPLLPQFFPNLLADDTLKPKLLFGSEQPDLSFKFEQWARLRLRNK